MPLRKTAVALPEDLLHFLEQAARARHESRNQLLISIVREAQRAGRDSEITARLNALFAQPAVAEGQSREAEILDRVGSSWEDEHW